MTFMIRMDQCPDGSWGVMVPDLPGCYSWGETREAAARNVVEAIEGYIDVSREYGKLLPDEARGARPDELIEITIGPDLADDDLDDVLHEA
ncbi:MAG: type II toxin-antitoxin system HicB family antitoxin [Candidatus Eremiobacteraeota bacterium]|nr:type II toxin-antitoxin system HicB family antitoxin [Candidatus Eremiobacteraeota bacterium]